MPRIYLLLSYINQHKQDRSVFYLLHLTPADVSSNKPLNDYPLSSHTNDRVCMDFHFLIM